VRGDLQRVAAGASGADVGELEERRPGYELAGSDTGEQSDVPTHRGEPDGGRGVQGGAGQVDQPAVVAVRRVVSTTAAPGASSGRQARRISANPSSSSGSGRWARLAGSVLVVVAAGGANAIGAFGRGSTGVVGYADVRVLVDMSEVGPQL
jgi:hypothetical protein